jgi:predicted nucleic acid-binding protein
MSEDRNRLRNETQRGEDARRVIESPAFQEALQALKTQIVDEWAKAPIRDIEGQRLLLQLHKLAHKFEALLTGMVETGKLAQVNIDAERDENTAQKLFRRVL